MDFEGGRNPKLYVCPGETSPISHAVHLGRLVNFYPACRECPFNCETGHVSKEAVEHQERVRARRPSTLAFPYGGVRGVYLNQITRATAARMVAQFAAKLWEDVARQVRTRRRERIETWSRPRLAIGYDSRHASPAIMTAIQDRLGRMGCDVIDIGQTTRPSLQFAIRHFETQGGVFVTGSGHTLAWTGLDFFDHAAYPRTINDLDLQMTLQPVFSVPSRPVRDAGEHRFQIVDELYNRRLQRHLRIVRPLRICVGVEGEIGCRRMEDVLGPIGVDLVVVKLPNRPRDLQNEDDLDVRRTATFLLEHEADLGFVISEDHQQCALLDEDGELVPPQFLSRALTGEGHGVVANHDTVEQLWQAVAARTARVVHADGVYAFPQRTTICDAMLTLIYTMNWLSRRQRSLAELVELDRAHQGRSRRETSV